MGIPEYPKKEKEMTAPQTASISPQAILLDVRTPAEFATGHLSGAVNIDFNDPDFNKNIQNLDHSKHYILYCRSGGRAAQAIALMRILGFQHLTNAGGYAAASQDLGIPLITD